MVERRRTDVGASQDCRFSAGQRRHRQCAPGWEVNWSAYQTRVNEDESAEGRFTYAGGATFRRWRPPAASGEFQGGAPAPIGVNASVFATTPFRGFNFVSLGERNRQMTDNA